MPRKPFQPRPSAPSTAALRAFKAATAPVAGRRPVVSETALRRALRATGPRQADGSLTGMLRTQATAQARGFAPRVLASLALVAVAGAGFSLIHGGSAYLAPAAILGALTCGAVLWRQARETRFGHLNEPLDLAAEFDRLAHSQETAWPETVTEAMAELRQTLARLLPIFPAALDDGSLDLQDAFFIRQTILSYLPDALNRFAEIPAAYRHQPQATSGRTPEQALAAQITSLTRKLVVIESGLASARARRLEVQARFIDHKTSS
ncbi:hypothetical protein [Methylomagnum sp.]